MRTFPIIVAAMTMLLMSFAAPAPVTAKDKDEEEPRDDFILLKTAGRQWTLKRTPKPGNEGGDTLTSYHHFEVMNVYDEYAELGQTTLDSSKKPTTDKPFILKIDFDLEDTIFKDPIGHKKVKIETIKTDAGKFKCVKWVNQTQDGTAILWRSVDFPGLVVKQDDRFGMRIIEEFTWVEGDPGHEADDDDDEEEIDPKRLYSNKRARWIHKTTFTKGPRDVRSFKVLQYEVKDVDDDQCEVEITHMTQLLRKIKDIDEETLVIKFDDEFADNYLQPGLHAKNERTERRITDIGLYECTVWTYRDEEGREARAWYANDWPGLIVRRVVTGKEYRAITEIVEFEE